MKEFVKKLKIDSSNVNFKDKISGITETKCLKDKLLKGCPHECFIFEDVKDSVMYALGKLLIMMEDEHTEDDIMDIFHVVFTDVLDIEEYVKAYGGNKNE